MSVANMIDVSELLNLTSPLTLDQVESLRSAVAGQQAGEIRQCLNELQKKVDAGDAPEATLARAGVACYLLSRHAEADAMMSQVTGDGVAIYFHAQVLTSLGRHADAASRFEDAGKAGFDQIEATLRQAGSVRAGGDAVASEPSALPFGLAEPVRRVDVRGLRHRRSQPDAGERRIHRTDPHAWRPATQDRDSRHAARPDAGESTALR